MADLKSLFLFLSLVVSTSLYAECVKEGGSVITYPNAPKCCSGLELQRPADGRVGVAGICAKKQTCVEEGGSVVVYPGAPQCCSGLELKRPTDGRVGSAGVCIKKQNCVEEGNAVITYPNAPQCCHGLELERPTDERMGIAGICRDKKHIVSEKVDDSERSKIKEIETKSYELRLKRVKRE